MPTNTDKFAIAITGAGSQTLTPTPQGAPTGSFSKPFIRVLSYHLTASGPTTVTFTGSVSGLTFCTDYVNTGSPIDVDDVSGGVFDLLPGDALIVNSSANNLGGCGRFAVMGAG